MLRESQVKGQIMSSQCVRGAREIKTGSLKNGSPQDREDLAKWR